MERSVPYAVRQAIRAGDRAALSRFGRAGNRRRREIKIWTVTQLQIDLAGIRETQRSANEHIIPLSTYD